MWPASLAICRFSRTICFSFALICAAAAAGRTGEAGGFRHFIGRSGDRLVDGSQVFRFVSFNIPNLHNLEDNLADGAPSVWRWPNEFEIRDAFESVRQMGGTAVRIYVISVWRQGSSAGRQVHVLGPGKFNEEAFSALDQVLELANEYQIRVIVPLVDNWHWWGGVREYAAFRQKPPEAFWDDEQLLADFEETIRFVLERKNTHTGVRYKNDKAILGWETGNELDAPPEWTSRMAATLKRVDPNHLVIDGNSLHGIPGASLADPNVDVVTTHHYPTENVQMVQQVRDAIEATAGKKPYFVGEFGFIRTPEIEQILDAVDASHACGALIWSLRFHNRDGGFYWHSEGASDGKYKAYHWPGFASGEMYDERNVLALLRLKASAIRGLAVPERAAPAAPHLLPIASVGHISWLGSAGAASYDVERATNPTGPWQVVGAGVSDAAVPYRPLFCDQSARAGGPYYYRVRASNVSGQSRPSNVVGPVRTSNRVFVDELNDLSRITRMLGPVRIVTDDARRAGEDLSRLRGRSGAEIVYRVDGILTGATVSAFCDGPGSALEFFTSMDGGRFSAVCAKATRSTQAASDYGYLMPVNYELGRPSGRYLKIVFAGVVGGSGRATASLEISRVELRYK